MTVGNFLLVHMSLSFFLSFCLEPALIAKSNIILDVKPVKQISVIVHILHVKTPFTVEIAS